MLLLPASAGPHDPVGTTPERAPGSVRRTSSIDTTRPDGLRGDSVVVGRARDLLTDRGGAATVVGEATLRARLAPGGLIVEVESTPPVALTGLLGSTVRAGFRALVARELPGEHARCTLLHLLLDDLPGATLVSGYALQRAGALGDLVPHQRRVLGPDETRDPGTADATAVGAADGTAEAADAERRRALAALFRSDICAGWAHEATLMSAIREQGEVPVPMGPPAPPLGDPVDALAWHPMPALGPHGMRRCRRLDLRAPAGAGGWPVDAHFRDSHVDDEGRETVLHEYTVAGEVDPAAGRIASVSATARVLPWTECPGAAASAGRLVGMPVAELRRRVREELVGRTTCTHLNDTLRSLADLSVLVRELSAGIAG